MDVLDYNYLIIGSGLAGLYSAAYASKFGKVALLTKSTIEISNSYWAQGGIAAVINEEDDIKFHVADTIEAGRGLCNKEAVTVLVEDGQDRIFDLISMGMLFDTENGKLALGLEGGHSKRRILHAGGDATGKKIVEFLKYSIKNNKNITVYENTFVYELMVHNNICYGAKTFNTKTNLNSLFKAKGTVIATGGASGIFQRSTNPKTSSGDGISLAYNAGAIIRDIEFIQFHPTVYHSPLKQSFLISEAVRGEGAYLVNSAGKRFMLDIDPLAELAPRDVVAKAIFYQLKNNNKVYLSLSHLNSEKIKKRFSTIYNELKTHNLDLTKDLIPVAPAAHYCVGGIQTDLEAKTSVNRLYACGESASTGVHGANRLASNSLLECLVFGKLAIDSINSCTDISFYSDKLNEISFDPSALKILEEFKDKIALLLTDCCGIIRNETELNFALTELDTFYKSFTFDKTEFNNIQIDMLFSVAKLLITAAKERKESRGGHIRTDFPGEDNSFTVHLIQQKELGIVKSDIYN